MDNASRSQRTRDAAIKAALSIIAREGASHLTLDAIAAESGISKGALTHQFRSKKEILEALLDRQYEFFSNFSRGYLAKHSAEHTLPELAAEIATLRETLKDSHSLVFALLGAIAEDPRLLQKSRYDAKKIVETIKKEAEDSDLTTVRWLAARGLAITALLGMCPLSKSERDRLFGYLLDDARWSVPPAQQRNGRVSRICDSPR